MLVRYNSSKKNNLIVYYNNLFLINKSIHHKYQYKPSTVCYPMLYRSVSIFYLTGWYSRLTNRNGGLNQVLIMNCHIAKNYFKVYIPLQMPLLFFFKSRIK